MPDAVILASQQRSTQEVLTTELHKQALPVCLHGLVSFKPAETSTLLKLAARTNLLTPNPARTCRQCVQVSYSHASSCCRRRSLVKVVVSVTSARTWSKIGSSTRSKMRDQNDSAKLPPWHLSTSNSTCMSNGNQRRSVCQGVPCSCSGAGKTQPRFGSSASASNTSACHRKPCRNTVGCVKIKPTASSDVAPTHPPSHPPTHPPTHPPS